MAYSIFPSLILLTLAFLVARRYRLPDRIEETFVASRRTGALKAFHNAALFLMPILFIMLHVLRASFLWNFFRESREAHFTLQLVVNLSIFGTVTLCEAIAGTHLWIYLFFSTAGLSRTKRDNIPPLSRFPRVSVLIPCCDEPPAVLERSVFSASKLAYPNLRVLLVENSLDSDLKAGARALAARHGIDVVDIPNRGNKAGALNDAMRSIDLETEYLSVLDADQAVLPDFLSAVIPLLEADSGIAFVQTPQVCANASDSLVATAASQQQMLLYDCVLDGKSAYERAPCYGTNFVMRRSALESVGGWDESNVTEDLATSYKVHGRGWKSIYMREVYAKGLAPVDLSSYWRQQVRWATGNSALFRAVLLDAIRRDRRRGSMWIAVEYLWSSGFCLYTMVLTIMTAWPSLLLVADLFTAGRVVGLFEMNASQWDVGLAYFTLYPVYAFVMLFPYVNMRLRGYPLRNMIMVQGLMASTAPVLPRAALRALMHGSPMYFQGSRSTQPAPREKFSSPQMAVLLVLLVTGSFLGSHVWHHPTSRLTWLLLFWTYVHTIAIAHFVIFFAQGSENRLAIKLGRSVCRR
jgi:cellulose synthase (UDP-forming)